MFSNGSVAIGFLARTETVVHGNTILTCYPMPVLLAIGEGTFMNLSIGKSYYPMPVLIIIDEGTFRDGSIS